MTIVERAAARRTNPTPLLTPEELRARVARLPRIPFAAVPTPLEEAPRFAETLFPGGKGPRILIKRDDLTGFAFGGNKVRAIEFRMADVKARGCDAFTLVNIGQSNHARLHSAACVRLGIKMVIVKPSPADEKVNGNLLLDRMLGVEIVEAHGRPSDEVLDEVLADLRRRGYTPYASTREPFSRLAGTIAFAEASIELMEQLRAGGITPGQSCHLFLVGGTSSTGLALGGKLLDAGWRMHAVSVGGSAESVRRLHLDLAQRAATLLDLPVALDPGDFDVHDEYVGARYADVTPGVREAIRLLARTDAIFLDPVYTGKAMSGLIGEVRKGGFGPDDTLVFVHTGGLPIIFAYDEVLRGL